MANNKRTTISNTDETTNNSVASKPHANCDECETFKFSDWPSLEHIRSSNDQFAKERNLETRDTPINILLALVAEAGELTELFKWKNEVRVGLPDWTQQEKEAVEQELSDVLIYLVRLADRCHIDLPAVALSKLKQNERKYPIDSHLKKH